MAVHIYTDASVTETKGRGAYIITSNNGTSFSAGNNYNRVQIFKTPVESVVQEKNGINADPMEFKTIIQALTHAFKLYPEEEYFKLYSDSQNGIDKFNIPWYSFNAEAVDPMILKIQRTIASRKVSTHLKLVHTKAHKGTLAGMPEKMNFACDLIASMKGE